VTDGAAAASSTARVSELLRAGAARLAPTSQTPRLDAELLLAEVLGVGRERLVLDRDADVEEADRERFTALLERRAACEPVAYLLGRRAFRGLELTVDSRVLVPRPETELLVEIGLELPAGATVLDVGCGSGALALALADERPDLGVRGVDVSPDAVAVARSNATRLSLNVSFGVGDLLVGAAPADAVLANLPYIAQDAPLPADVADWEPPTALYGGADGLALIRRLLAAVARTAWPSVLALEIGETQGEAVTEMVAGAGFEEVAVRRDLAGRDRVVVGRR
jgi:release factor glutamine methyltransferase